MLLATFTYFLSKTSKIMKYIFRISFVLLSVALILFSFKKPSQEVPNITPIKSSQLVKVSAGFGMRTHPLTKAAKMHTGIDYVAKLGTPVMATADGKVIKIEHKSTGYGNNLIIKHANGFKTRYSQLKDIKVTLGQKVSQKDIVGTVGSSGTSTGPHLHYEIELNGTKVNPEYYINN